MCLLICPPLRESKQFEKTFLKRGHVYGRILDVCMYSLSIVPNRHGLATG